MTTHNAEELKRLLGYEVARRVKDGDTIGIGAGTTVNRAIQEIGKRVRNEDLKVRVFAASIETEQLCLDAGINLTARVRGRLAWGFDGADEVDPDLNLLKGSGGKMLRERIVAETVNDLVILVEEAKFVPRIGETRPVPIEVIPSALEVLFRKLKGLSVTSASCRVDDAGKGYVITESGNLIIDATFEQIPSHAQLKVIPGVVETGIFENLCTEVLIASNRGLRSIRREKGKTE